MEETGKRLRRVREEMGLTQTDAAKILAVSQRVYSNYEAGEVRVSVETLIALAKNYNLSLDYLSGVSDVRKPYPDK